MTGSERAGQPYAGGGTDIDVALVQSAQKGDRAARAVLLERHLDLVFGLAMRLLGHRDEAEEVSQDALVEAIRSLRSLKDPAAFRGWLSQIVVFTVRRYLRKKRLFRRLGLESPSEPMDLSAVVSKDTPPDVAADFAQIYRTLDGLSEKFRVVMIMRHVEGWQIDDIAAAMRSSRASVNRWLRDAEAAALRALNRGRPPALLGDKGRA